MNKKKNCVMIPRTITKIAMILTAIAVGIAIWTQMICAIMRTNFLPFSRRLLQTLDPTPAFFKVCLIIST